MSKQKIKTRQFDVEGTNPELRPEPQIGARIRHARLRKGWTLRTVADKIACSESFVSKVEHDRVRPSLATLHQLVRALELNVAALFEEGPFDEDPVFIVHPEDRAVIRAGAPRDGPGVTLLRLIASRTAKLLEANIHVVEPGGGSNGVIRHEGEEMGYVLEGELELLVADRTYFVPARTTFFFSSHLPHGYRNSGKERTSVIWINTPPTF